MASSAPVPDSLGPYRVIRPIARGGMAEVYEVEDPVSGERFAMKLLMQVGSALPRFSREYEALTRLNHPNIVRVFAYGFYGRQPWITMELLQGIPMQTRLKGLGRPGEPVRTAEVLRIAWYVAGALHYIHQRGLVHRDLKSDNVMVLPDGRVKLLDFGTAYLRDPVEQITREGEFVGTFAYASPEQLMGERVDARADLYSLGVLLYRMCTGQRPFDAEDPRTLARMHATQSPRPPRELAPGLPEPLEALILHLLAKKAEDRPTTAAVVRRTLAQIAGSEPDIERRISLVSTTELPIGREPELRALVGVLDGLPAGGVLLIEGGDGSHRGRFVRSLVDAVQERSWYGFSCTLRSERPVNDLLEVLDAIGAPLQSGKPGRAAADVLRRMHGMDLDTGRVEVLKRAAAQVVSERARSEPLPVVLAVQNVHAADPLVLDMLAAISREAVAAEAAVLLVLSTVELADHPAVDVALRDRFAEAARYPLPPLSVRGVGLAIAAMLHRRPPTPDFARRIHRATGGQPAYVEELVRLLVSRGVLEARGVAGNRIEYVDKVLSLPPTPSAHAAAEAAWLSLPTYARRVVEALAIAEGDAPWRAVANALGMGSHDLKLTIDQLQRVGLARRDEDQLTLVKPLLAEVALASTHITRLRLLQRKLVDELPHGTRGRIRLLCVAGRHDDAGREVVATARDLLDHGRAEEALEIVDPVVKGLAGASPDVLSELTELFVVYARVMIRSRPTDASLAKALAKAQELAPDDALRLDVLVAKAQLQATIGHYPNYRKHLLEAWELADRGRDASRKIELGSEIGRIFQWLGQPKTAADWFDKVRKIAADTGDERLFMHACVAEASWRLAVGNLTDADELSREAIRIASELGDESERAIAAAARANVLCEMARFTEALDLLYPALAVARERGEPSVHVALLLAAARTECDLARLGRAQELLDELEATSRPGEHLHLRLEAGLVRGRILVASGQWADADRHLTELVQRGRAAEIVFVIEGARALLAEVKWALGDAAAARDLFRTATLGLMGTGDQLALAEASVSRARYIDVDEDPDEVLAVARELVEREPAVRLRIAWLLARARASVIRGESPTPYLREAANVINTVAEGLGLVERSAMRVHPWSRVVRSGARA